MRKYFITYYLLDGYLHRKREHEIAMHVLSTFVGVATAATAVLLARMRKGLGPRKVVGGYEMASSLPFYSGSIILHAQYAFS